MTNRIEITNDTEVFDAMRFDAVTGDMVWTGRVGTREAIRREKLAIDPGSWNFCPHEWLDERGFVDRAPESGERTEDARICRRDGVEAHQEGIGGGERRP